VSQPQRKFAIVTGASSGIGLELARQCARDGHDLLLVADRPLHEAAEQLAAEGANLDRLEIDLAREAGVDELCRRAQILGRPVDALIVNASRGLSKGFLDQEWDDIRSVVDINVTGTARLIHRLARDMRERGEGRILVTGSIAGLAPGARQAVYSGAKAFLDAFCCALRGELEDSGVTVTWLMPRATQTDDPAEAAKIAYRVMQNGGGDAAAGLTS
jgi:short-subunit dehydrogenase